MRLAFRRPSARYFFFFPVRIPPGGVVPGMRTSRVDAAASDPSTAVLRGAD